MLSSSAGRESLPSLLAAMKHEARRSMDAWRAVNALIKKGGMHLRQLVYSADFDERGAPSGNGSENARNQVLRYPMTRFAACNAVFDLDPSGQRLLATQQNAESMGRSKKSKGAAEGSVGAGELEDIPEEEMQFDEEREQPCRQMNGNLTTIKEDDGEEAAYAPTGTTSTIFPA